MTTVTATVVAPLRITLFGPLSVQVQGEPMPHLRSRKAQWLLALLILRHGRSVQREWLAGTLWPEVEQEQGFANLRPVLSELRKALGTQSERLQSPNRHSLRLDLTDIPVDLLEFDTAMASKSPSAWERAVALYQGPLLEGCAEEWVTQERVQREQACLQALKMLAESALAAGKYGAASDYWRRAVVLDPLWEVARRGRMEALDKGGDRNAALQVYREFVDALRSNDPRAVPTEETTTLYRRLRDEARSLAVRPVPTEAKEVRKTPDVVGYLPYPLTELVGREDECLEVATRLHRSRLVTLTGPGGIGKTRLALSVAHQSLQEYRDGVWFVALESLFENGQVADQIAAVVGAKEELNRSPLQTVTERLRGRQILLVLDNCEHLVEAVAQVIGHLLQECGELRVLATSREILGIKGETTWAVPSLAVPKLKHLPKGNNTRLRVIMSYESVQLFVERAQAVQRTFSLTESNAETVAAICSYLEGIPLAIELAAARVKTLTLEQIAGRLHDRLGLIMGQSLMTAPRQQTLRTTVDWSYTLLNEQERLLLQRLSIFVDGWSLEAAESVCAGEEIAVPQILDILTSLTEKSLVTFSEQEIGGRYRLLEMLRQYGAEKLEMSGEANRIKDRHRDCFLALAEKAEPELTGTEQRVWLRRLDAELANLRTALAWCRDEKGDSTVELRMVGALFRFWEIHGHYSEGWRYLSGALAKDTLGTRTRERARALYGAGALAYYQNDYEASVSLQQEALVIFRELGDRQGVARSLNIMGDVARAQGDSEAVQTLYGESLTIFRELGDRQGAASLLHHMGRVVREQGDFVKARALYEESLAIVRELGNRQNVAWSLHHLGNVAGAQGDYMAAWSLQQEALEIFRELGDRQGIAWSLNDLGDVARAQGDSEVAQTLYGESLAIFRELGDRQGAASLLNRQGKIRCEQGHYAEAQKLCGESLIIFRELGNHQGVAWSLNNLGQIACEQGDYAKAEQCYREGVRLMKSSGDRSGTSESLAGLALVLLTKGKTETAVRLWGCASTLADSLNRPQSSFEQKRSDRLTKQARLLLGDIAFVTAREEGTTLTVEQAVMDALELEPL